MKPSPRPASRKSGTFPAVLPDICPATSGPSWQAASTRIGNHMSLLDELMEGLMGMVEGNGGRE
jgi:hypothetical protein